MTQPVPSYPKPAPDDAEQQPADSSRPSTASDGELVARIRLGDIAAFEEMFHTYYEPLCSFALTYVGSPMGAEDVVQDTFARIWERRTEWEVRGRLRGYLYTAVRNRALTQLRHVRVVARTRAQHEVTSSGRTTTASDEHVRMHEMAEALARAIDELPARRRQAYTLRWQHELSLAEIAAAMGVTVKCAEAHLAAASKTIRERLAMFL